MENLLGLYPVVIEIPVSWGDMDAFQHVNNTMYFKYFESARISYFEKLEFMDIMNNTGIGPILAATQCRFKIPLTYPDTISVGAKVEAIKEDRFFMTYAVMSHNHKKIAALGEGEIVLFDYQNNKKSPVPDEIRARINSLENSVGHGVQGQSALSGALNETSMEGS